MLRCHQRTIFKLPDFLNKNSNLSLQHTRAAGLPLTWSVCLFVVLCDFVLIKGLFWIHQIYKTAQTNLPVEARYTSNSYCVFWEIKLLLFFFLSKESGCFSKGNIMVSILLQKGLLTGKVRRWKKIKYNVSLKWYRLFCVRQFNCVLLPSCTRTPPASLYLPLHHSMEKYKVQFKNPTLCLSCAIISVQPYKQILKLSQEKYPPASNHVGISRHQTIGFDHDSGAHDWILK